MARPTVVFGVHERRPSIGTARFESVVGRPRRRTASARARRRPARSTSWRRSRSAHRRSHSWLPSRHSVGDAGGFEREARGGSSTARGRRPRCRNAGVTHLGMVDEELLGAARSEALDEPENADPAACRVVHRGDPSTSRTAAMTRSWSASVRLEPLGRHRPGGEDPLGDRSAGDRCLGEQRLEVHRLPRRAGLDVVGFEPEANLLGCRTCLGGIEGDHGEPVGRFAIRRVGHESDAGQARRARRGSAA